MENYLHPEISALRKLSLPNGLQELMSDITREVLRAQPSQLYGFIRDYLSAMLVTRENLQIASYIHDDICCCLSAFELDKELGNLELSDEDILKVSQMIRNHLENTSQVKECNIIQNIMKNVNIGDYKISELQDIIREAFVRHSARKVNFEQDLSACSSKDEIAKAVENTLNIYKQTGPSEADYNKMAQRIQTAYRGYGITRNLKHVKCYLPSPTDDISVNESVSKQSPASFTQENAEDEGQIEELYIQQGTVNSIASLQTYQEEESVLEEIHGVDDVILDDYNYYETQDLIESHSDPRLKTKRNVSFNANEQELDTYDYENKSSDLDSPDEHEEVVESIEEELVSNEDNLSIMEDCASIYDINDQDVSDIEINGE